MSYEQRRQAVVIGASFAGLVAARVLSQHFGHVVLIEKDAVNESPETRRSQPQTRHLHGLLAAGLDTLERYFPGLTEELIQHGAIYDDIGMAVRWHQCGGYRRQFQSGLFGVVQSRPLLEYLIRRRVLALDNITLRASHQVLGLTVHDSMVSGVHVKGSDGAMMINADLVLDTTGRGSSLPLWLEEIGYQAPKKEEVLIRLGYSTRTYSWKKDDLPGAKLVFSVPSPPTVLRSGYLAPLEGQRWMLTVGGWHGDYPPADERGLLDFVRSLPTEDIYRVIRSAEPLTDIVTYRFRSNMRRHYSKLKSFPGGVLPLGDAVASFNPVYGQGMTSAALQAAALDECLRKGTDMQQLYRTYFKRVTAIVDIPWDLATGADFMFPDTKGRKPLGIDILNAYVNQVHKATHTDTVVYHNFLKVMNLTQPAASLMHPKILWRVGRARLVRRK